MAGVAFKGRLIALSIALVAAGGAALAVGYNYLRPAAKVEVMALGEVPPAAKDPAPASSQAPAASPAQQEINTALATAKNEAAAALSDLVASPTPAPAAGSGPAFDLARVEETGEAVIAGRAAPGATVELLREGKTLDQVVADASGQFVMVSRLPAGKYDLTLRSKASDGTVALSTKGVPVALNEVASSPAAPSRADAAPAGKQLAAASPPSQARAAAPASDAAPASPKLAAADTTGAIDGKSSTKIVSRGDSLWRISRLTYGDGNRYAIIYKANRGLIRDPNRIYPGQTFVLPTKER
ncbi:MAG: LysM peptidoglycan-binding domain-containing protein [Bradyrhizobium sp.]|uniref:LysM peptidoglycan-binding domain-containing protein n=1 Tax=Bradyrhizobium sp. TaxID=376 RepID=UPI0025C0DA33|nr:LysM peptidoglycan-binding domain-containing protein [Bradyrhizobium sp.]MBI5262754.1 LysM peptidoglycan-binding domain-containing protein [Bradyrhizobium sp.]